eukprot:gene3465-3943_t
MSNWNVTGGDATEVYVPPLLNHEVPTIFVSMAAYRDVMCSDTLNYLFENAKHPERIFVGLVDQGSEVLDPPEDITTIKSPDWPNSHCFRGLRVKPELIKTNLRRLAMTIEESKGPTVARYKASTLYRNETYFMQIDSHVRFIQDWDAYIIANLWALRDRAPTGLNGVPRAILSHYPLPFEMGQVGLPADDQTSVPRLCKAVFNGRGIITFNSYILPATKMPVEIPFIAAGFFFGTAEFLKPVPFDPYLPNLFEGEEITFSVRLWTNGYRFYTPTLNICYHFYTRSGHPKFWEDQKSYNVDMDSSVSRIKYILGLETDVDLQHPRYQDIDKYNIKNRTALEEYWKVFDIDNVAKTQDTEKWCSSKRV